MVVVGVHRVAEHEKRHGGTLLCTQLHDVYCILGSFWPLGQEEPGRLTFFRRHGHDAAAVDEVPCAKIVPMWIP